MTEALCNSLLFLGTGASLGVPVVGCSCEVCSSSNKKNQRLRASALLTVGGKRFLIDCGPDFRRQALRIGLSHLDGLYLTHAHYDHIAGIDELRTFTSREKPPLPCLASAETMQGVHSCFAYLFDGEGAMVAPLRTRLAVTLLPSNSGEISFAGIPTGYCRYEQSGMQVNGFRWGELAYLCDIKRYEDELFSFLKGIKILVISAICRKPSYMHQSIEEAILFSKRCGATATYITHTSHNIDYDVELAQLPEGLFLAYDGLEIPFQI